MAQQTTHIRIRVETRARLDAEIERMVAAYERGLQESLPPTESNAVGHKGITIDALINHLLDQRTKHRERVKKYRGKAAAGKGGAA
jgi:hypothetical protein